MARGVAEQISVNFKKQFFDVFDTGQLFDLSVELAQVIHNIIERRTDAGFDIKGQKFKRLSKDYKEVKRRVIKGQTAKNGRKNKSIQRLVSKKIAGKAARSVNDYMHLTGELFEDIRFRIKQPKVKLTSITLPIQFYVAPRSAEKAHGLKYKMHRDMFFLSKSGRFKKIEHDIISDFIKDSIDARIGKVAVKSRAIR